jgi:hypothetical protein
MGSGQGEGVRASRDEMATGTRWGDARWSSTILDANDAAGTTFLSRSCDDITTLDARPPNCYQIMSCLGLPAFWLWLLRCAGINKTRCTARFLPQTLCDAICRASSLSAIRCRTSSLTLLGKQARISSDILVCTAEHLKHHNGAIPSCSFPDFELFLPLPLQFFFLFSQESLRTSSTWIPYCKCTPH